MDKFTLLIALVVALCSLAATFFLFFYCRKIERRCNRNIAKSLREQDRLAQELEHTRVEKESIEKAFKTTLSEGVESSLMKAMVNEEMPPSENRILRIDIAY